MMRAVRFASQLGFTIEGETFDAIPVSYTHLDVYKRQRREC